MQKTGEKSAEDIKSQASVLHIDIRAGRILFTQKMPVLSMLGPNVQTLLFPYKSVLQSLCKYWQQYHLHCLFSTVSYERGQLLLEKVSTCQQMLQARD